MRKLIKDETGATAVFTVFIFVILLLFSAFVLDFGLAYVEESKLQTACDSAALAAAAHLPKDVNKAKQEAISIMRDNGYDITECDVDISADKKTVVVKKEVDVQTNIAKIINIKAMKVTKSATASSGKFELDYALFSASTETNVEVNGAMHVDGDAHINKSWQFTGSLSNVDVTGKLETMSDPLVGDGTSTIVNSDPNYNADYVEIPHYEQAIMDRIPLSYTTYENLNEFCMSKYGESSDSLATKGTSIEITGNVKIKTMDNARMPIKITGNLISENTIEFENTVTIDNGGVYCENSSIQFSASHTVYLNGYIVAEGQITMPHSLLNVSNDANYGYESIIYSISSNITMQNTGAYSVSAMLYAPQGGVYSSHGSFEIRGGVIANEVHTSAGASISIKPADKEWNNMYKTSGGIKLIA